MSRTFTESTATATAARRPRARERWAILDTAATDANTAAVARAIAWVAIAALLLVGLGLGAKRLHQVLFSANPRFTLKSLHIQTGNTVSAEQIRQVTAIREGCNLFALDLPGVRRNFLRTLPNVREIRLERHLPDTLRVTVFERMPVARLSRSGRVVVDFDGYLFIVQPAQESLVDALPILSSEEWASLQPGQRISERPRSALTVLDVADAMRLHFRIASIDTTGPHYLLLQTTDRHEIGLPWRALDQRETINTMLTEVSTVIASPRAANCNRFDVHPESGKVFARYQ